jgi:hypothetical protein
MGTSIRLLTFNTLFRGRPRPRLQALSQALDGMQLDVVCLQELLGVATAHRPAHHQPRCWSRLPVLLLDHA